MKIHLLCPSLAFLTLVVGTSCSTPRFTKTSSAQNRSEIIARIPVEEETSSLAETTAAAAPAPTAAETSSSPELEPPVVKAPFVKAPVVKTPVIDEVESVVPTNKLPQSLAKTSSAEKAVPAPAVITTGPSPEEKAAALATERAQLAGFPEATAKKVPSADSTKDGFSPKPYFTLFTKTGEDAAAGAESENDSASATATPIE